MSNFVTIKSSDRAAELYVARSYLESYDISVYLKDEYTNQVHPAAIGGVKLQVKEEDAERAINLLIEGGFASKEDYEPSKSEVWLSKVLDNISSFFKRK